MYTECLIIDTNDFQFFTIYAYMMEEANKNKIEQDSEKSERQRVCLSRAFSIQNSWDSHHQSIYAKCWMWVEGELGIYGGEGDELNNGWKSSVLFNNKLFNSSRRLDINSINI